MELLQYRRELPIEASYDLVVVGGGPAGVAAAIAAGRLGQQVVLIEQMGCLGGIGTSGLVTAFCPFADGERTLVQGSFLELVEALHTRGFLPARVSADSWRQGRREALRFNAEGLKLLMDEFVGKAGVEIRFFNTLVDVVTEGTEIKSLIVSGKEGLYAMRAPFYVDATGDAVLTAMAEFPFEVGDEQGNTQGPTLCSIVGNVDVERYHAFTRKSRRPGDWQSLMEPLERAFADGVITIHDLHLPGLFICGEGYGVLNAGHLYGLDCLSDKELSRGMIWGRKMVQEYLTFYRNYVEGCEQMTHLATGAIMGVRETRRVVGEYVLNVNDFVALRSFDDEIGRYNYPIDIHRSNASEEEHKKLVEEFTSRYRLGPGQSYGIPYRSLVAKGSTNLLVAGRCISTDRMVQGSTRVMPCCFMTGQAAGVAAALCGQKDIPTMGLDAGLLRQTLREQGAYLP